MIFGYTYLQPPPADHLKDPRPAARYMSPFGARYQAQGESFGGHASHTPSGDGLPQPGVRGSRLGALWLRVRLVFADTRNRRRPLAPLLLRSGVLRRA